MLKRRIVAAVLIGVCVGASVVAKAVAADARFATTVVSKIDGKAVRLTLTGTAVRKRYGFTVYAVASYVQEGTKVKDADGLSRSVAAKQLHMIFNRDVDGETMAKAFRASIGMSHPAPAFASELASLEQYFLAHPLKQGDHVLLTHVPGVGLVCQVAGQPSHLAGGVGFAHAAWGTYLGRKNLGDDLKAGLTSRL